MKWHYTLMRLFLQLFFGFVLLILIYLAVPGLSFYMWDLLPSPGVEPSFPTLGVWSLS